MCQSLIKHVCSVRKAVHTHSSTYWPTERKIISPEEILLRIKKNNPPTLRQPLCCPKGQSTLFESQIPQVLWFLWQLYITRWYSAGFPEQRNVALYQLKLTLSQTKFKSKSFCVNLEKYYNFGQFHWRLRGSEIKSRPWFYWIICLYLKCTPGKKLIDFSFEKELIQSNFLLFRFSLLIQFSRTELNDWGNSKHQKNMNLTDSFTHYQHCDLGQLFFKLSDFPFPFPKTGMLNEMLTNICRK